MMFPTLSFCLRTLLAVAVCSAFSSGAMAACEKLADEASYSKKMAASMFLVEGNDGYLFISKKDMLSEYPIKLELIPYAKRFVDALEARGIHTVLVVQPPRGLVHQDKISPEDKRLYNFDPVAARKSFQDMIAKLRGAGFTVATLSDLDMPDYAHRRDHHWTANGAKAVAADVFLQVKDLPFYASLPKIEFETLPAKENKKFSGALSNIYKTICQETLDPSPIPEYTTVVSTKENGSAEADLFGETPTPVAVLAGTSFSSNEAAHANFDGWLKEFLSVDVVNYAVRGGGFNSGVLSYLASDDYKNRKQSLLIWEIPAYLRFGSEGDWRELAAAPYGDCKGSDRNVLSLDLALTDKKTILFGKDNLSSLKQLPSRGFLETIQEKHLKKKNAESMVNGVYLFMSFKSAPKGELKLRAYNAKEKAWNVSLEHSARLGDNLPYYADLGNIGDFDRLELDVETKDVGLTGNVRLCRYP